MAVRYYSADCIIQAAGAAFACPDEDFSTPRVVRKRSAKALSWLYASSFLFCLIV